MKPWWILKSSCKFKIKSILRQRDCNDGPNLELVEPITFECSKCKLPKPREEFHEAKGEDRKRDVTSQCRSCRSESYFAHRYPDQICAQCQRHRALDKNKVCPECNDEGGLRQCRVCTELLPLFLKFYSGRKTCKDCAASLRRTRTQV